jgi:hypothetical protein
MKTFEVKISFNWWRMPETDDKPVYKRHMGRLEAYALDHITTQTSEGFREGNLNCEVERIQYRGYWSTEVTSGSEPEERCPWCNGFIIKNPRGKICSTLQCDYKDYI